MVGKFEEGIEEGIASFFFFNYFCPALLSPCDFGLWEGQVPPYALRGLILLSKVCSYCLFYFKNYVPFVFPPLILLFDFIVF